MKNIPFLRNTTLDMVPQYDLVMNDYVWAIIKDYFYTNDWNDIAIILGYETEEDSEFAPDMEPIVRTSRVEGNDDEVFVDSYDIWGIDCLGVSLPNQGELASETLFFVDLRKTGINLVHCYSE